MRRVIKQRLKHLSYQEYRFLKALSISANKLKNLTIQMIENHYDKTGSFLSHNELYHSIKLDPVYKGLNSNMSQQIIRNVYADYSSFFALLKLKNNNQYDKRIKKPRLTRKLSVFFIQQFRIKNRQLLIPMTREQKKDYLPLEIKIPYGLNPKDIAFIQIIPKFGSFFVHYVLKNEKVPTKQPVQKALAVDFGMKNLMTCATSEGKSFIIDGKSLLSHINHSNYKWSQIQQMKNKQDFHHITKREKSLRLKNQNYLMDYIHKAVKKVIDFALEQKVNLIICGYHPQFQQETKLGRRTNRKFNNIPYGLIRQYLTQACERVGIHYTEQEESYTSKSSFFDNDIIPIFQKDHSKYTFGGKRISRGIYQTSSGYKFNADVNGALNILKKYIQNKQYNTVSHQLMTLCRNGVVDTPVRIRIY